MESVKSDVTSSSSLENLTDFNDITKAINNLEDEEVGQCI